MVQRLGELALFWRSEGEVVSKRTTTTEGWGTGRVVSVVMVMVVGRKVMDGRRRVRVTVLCAGCRVWSRARLTRLTSEVDERASDSCRVNEGAGHSVDSRVWRVRRVVALHSLTRRGRARAGAWG